MKRQIYLHFYLSSDKIITFWTSGLINVVIWYGPSSRFAPMYVNGWAFFSSEISSAFDICLTSSLYFISSLGIMSHAPIHHQSSILILPGLWGIEEYSTFYISLLTFSLPRFIDLFIYWSDPVLDFWDEDLRSSVMINSGRSWGLLVLGVQTWAHPSWWVERSTVHAACPCDGCFNLLFCLIWIYGILKNK